MSAERDELAKVIDPKAFRVVGELAVHLRQEALKIADAILAAGFRKGTEEVRYEVVLPNRLARTSSRITRLKVLEHAEGLVRMNQGQGVIYKQTRFVSDWEEEVVS